LLKTEIEGSPTYLWLPWLRNDVIIKLLTLPGLGFFENLKAGDNISRMGYARNLKFSMVVATNNRSKKIMLNKQWLLWLPREVILKYQNLQNTLILF